MTTWSGSRSGERVLGLGLTLALLASCTQDPRACGEASPCFAGEQCVAGLCQVGLPSDMGLDVGDLLVITQDFGVETPDLEDASQDMPADADALDMDAVSCLSDMESCAAGMVCDVQSERCVIPEPGCPSGCGALLMCVGGVCVECVDADACGQGMVCEQGACKPGAFSFEVELLSNEDRGFSIARVARLAQAHWTYESTPFMFKSSDPVSLRFELRLPRAAGMLTLNACTVEVSLCSELTAAAFSRRCQVQADLMRGDTLLTGRESSDEITFTGVENFGSTEGYGILLIDQDCGSNRASELRELAAPSTLVIEAQTVFQTRRVTLPVSYK